MTSLSLYVSLGVLAIIALIIGSHGAKALYNSIPNKGTGWVVRWASIAGLALFSTTAAAAGFMVQLQQLTSITG